MATITRLEPYIRPVRSPAAPVRLQAAADLSSEAQARAFLSGLDGSGSSAYNDYLIASAPPTTDAFLSGLEDRPLQAEPTTPTAEKLALRNSGYMEPWTPPAHTNQPVSPTTDAFLSGLEGTPLQADTALADSYAAGHAVTDDAAQRTHSAFKDFLFNTLAMPYEPSANSEATDHAIAAWREMAAAAQDLKAAKDAENEIYNPVQARQTVNQGLIQNELAGMEYAAGRTGSAKALEEKAAENFDLLPYVGGSGLYTAQNFGMGTVQSVEGILNGAGYMGQMGTRDQLRQQYNDFLAVGRFDLAEDIKKTLDRMEEEGLQTTADFADPLRERLENTYSYVPKTEGLQIAANAAEGVGGMVPSIVLNPVARWLSLAMMGTNAAGNATKKALEAGADDNSAYLYGGVVGAVEMATEKIFDGVAGVFGKGAADDLVKTAAKTLATSELGQAAFRQLVSILGEGFEEWIAEYAEAYANKLIVGQDKRTVGEIRKDAAGAFAMGALISVIMSGASITKYNAAEIAAKAAEISSTDVTELNIVDNTNSSAYNELDKKGGVPDDGRGSLAETGAGIPGMARDMGTAAEGRPLGDGDLLNNGVVRSLSDTARSTLEKRGVVIVDMNDVSTDKAAFSAALDEARAADKNGWTVSPKTVAALEESGARLFMSKDGTTGFAITPGGDIEAVFSNKAKGTPFVYIMMHNGDSADAVVNQFGNYHIYTQAELDALPSFDKNGYENAVAYRDSLLGRTTQADVTSGSDGTVMTNADAHQNAKPDAPASAIIASLQNGAAADDPLVRAIRGQPQAGATKHDASFVVAKPSVQDVIDAEQSALQSPESEFVLQDMDNSKSSAEVSKDYRLIEAELNSYGIDISIIDKFSETQYVVDADKPAILGVTKHYSDNLQGKADRANLNPVIAQSIMDNANLTLYQRDRGTLKYISDNGYVVLSMDRRLITVVPEKMRNKYKIYLEEK